MQKLLGELSAEEFEELVERTIDRRLRVWFIQLIDSLTGFPEEKSGELHPDFVASLKRSIEQAHSGEGIALKSFRDRLGR